MYDEAVSGDIDEHSDPFVLGVGRNTLDGSVSWTGSGFIDFDSFTFVVPDGTQVVSMVYDVATAPEGTGVFTGISYRLDDLLPPSSPSSVVPIFAFDERLDRADWPIPLVHQEVLRSVLPPSRYEMSARGFSGRLDPGEFGRAVYTWTLVLEPCVPASSCRSTTLVNDAVTFDRIRSTYYLAGSCSRLSQQPLGEVFGFTARLTARDSAPPLTQLIVRIVRLTPDRYVLSVGRDYDLMPVPQVGQYADGVLSEGESVDVPFAICLPNRDPFAFEVDVWGHSD